DEFLDVFDTEVQFKDGTVGQLYRVAAVAGTNDGKRPTFVAFDETHEWTGNKKRVHLVLSNGIAKRSDCWGLEITTAGA
ncbi:terminase large subunit domain-containing protein, partial [Klebsiella pneumoniae]|uniref:terminase large subunit domain-containing protein n=1 Tax=Klebsiella pneumoniae TaxID=573 RepID=UPI003B987515